MEGEEGCADPGRRRGKKSPASFPPRSRLLAARAAVVRAIASPDLDTPGFLDGRRSRDLDLQDAVLEVGFDLIVVHVLGSCRLLRNEPERRSLTRYPLRS